MRSDLNKLIKRAKGFWGFMLFFLQLLTAALLIFQCATRFASLDFGGVDLAAVPAALAGLSAVVTIAYLLAFCMRKRPGTAMLKIIHIVKLVVLLAAEAAAVCGIVWACMFPEDSLRNDIAVLYDNTGIDLRYILPGREGLILIFSITAAALAAIIVYTAMTVGMLSRVKKAYKGTAKKGSSGFWGVVSIVFSIAVLAAGVYTLFNQHLLREAAILFAVYLILYALRHFAAGMIGVRWAGLASEYAVIERLGESNSAAPAEAAAAAAAAPFAATAYNQEPSPEAEYSPEAGPAPAEEEPVPADDANIIQDDSSAFEETDMEQSEPVIYDDSLQSSPGPGQVGAAQSSMERDPLNDTVDASADSGAAWIPPAAAAASYAASSPAGSPATEPPSFVGPLPVNSNGLIVYPYSENSII